MSGNILQKTYFCSIHNNVLQTKASLKKIYKLWLVPALLLIMSITLLFSMRIQEPYPALIQPAFKNTIPIAGPIQTWHHTATATTATGKEIAIDYNALFTPVETHGLLFHFYATILKEDPNLGDRRPGDRRPGDRRPGDRRPGDLPWTRPRPETAQVAKQSSSTSGTWLYRRLVQPYLDAQEETRRTRYEGLQQYLKQRTEWLAGEDVARLQLRRYRVTKRLEEEGVTMTLNEEKYIHFDQD